MGHLKFLVIIFVSFEIVFGLEYPSCQTKWTSGKCTPIWKCKNVFQYKDDDKYGPFIARSMCSIPGVRDIRNVCCDTNEIANVHPNLRMLDLENCGQATGDKISNGNKTRPFEYPWMALLEYDDSSIKCGGTLINDRYVLTAAHCLRVQGRELISVTLGEHTIGSESDCIFQGGEKLCTRPVQKIGIDDAITHPLYNRPVRRMNDIGLIRLSRSADLSEDDVIPICLPVTDELRLKQDVASRNYIVTGWGLTEEGPESNVLLQGKVPFLDSSSCKTKLKTAIHESQFCAGGEDSKVDNCRGDSGGPLQNLGRLKSIRFVQFGVVSYGQRNCGEKTLPGVYTDVGYYLDWILDQMKP